MNLLVSSEDLYCNRGKEIIEFIRIIHPSPRNIQTKLIPQSGQMTIVVSDRYITSNQISVFDFRTTSKLLKASYYEVWVKYDNFNHFLSKAYFHLYRTDNEYLETVREDGEYILLHCDPNEEGNHRDYKRSPHIHIEEAKFPINKAHFALNLMNLNEILSSKEKLDNALKVAITMLKEQVIEYKLDRLMTK